VIIHLFNFTDIIFFMELIVTLESEIYGFI